MASLADRLSPRPAPTPLHDPDLCACLQPAWDGAGGGAAAAAAAAGGGGGGGGVPMRRRVRGRGPVRAAPRRGAARRPPPHRRRQGAGPLRPRLAPLPRARAARQLRLRPRQLRHPRRPDALRRRRRTGLPAAPGPGPGRALAHMARVLLGGIAKPIHALAQILSPAAAAVSRRSDPPLPASPPAPVADVSHHPPSEVLRSFRELRCLHIELPTGELGIDDGVLLKWKADFGSTLGSCVILGASSVLSKPPTGSTTQAEPAAADSTAAAPDTSRETEEPGSLPDSLYTNGGLKLRVVWTISSLIAASARHYSLHPIICNHETLESLDLTDADGQGVLTMDKRQLQELRVRPVSPSESSHRTLMPALSMRLHYAPLIELPGGTLLKGATLVAIRPSEDALREGQGAGAAGPVGTCWISEAFEEPYRTAAKVLLKRRAYCLEMNSF